MAATCQISSEFVISVTLDAAAAHTITSPGRTFRIVNIDCYNAGGTPNITVTDAAANAIAATQAAATNSWKSLALTEAHCNVTSSENLIVTNADVATTKLIIRCVASGGGESLTIT